MTQPSATRCGIGSRHAGSAVGGSHPGISVIQSRNFLLFWQTFLEARVLNFESGIYHCGSTAPCPPCLSSLNTEHTERLCDLRVEGFSGTEDTEVLTTREEIFTAGVRARPPSPGPPRLMKTPVRSTLSPKGGRAEIWTGESELGRKTGARMYKLQSVGFIPQARDYSWFAPSGQKHCYCSQ